MPLSNRASTALSTRLPSGLSVAETHLLSTVFYCRVNISRCRCDRSPFPKRPNPNRENGQTKGQRQRQPEAVIEPPPLRVEYADPLAQVTQMQQALLAAVQGSKAPIPPPLSVVMGFKVRDEQRVVIESNEFEWRDGMPTLYLEPIRIPKF